MKHQASNKPLQRCPTAGGPVAKLVALESVDWVTCPICGDEVGFPPTFAAKVACCPKCAGLVQLVPENRVLWRPAADAKQQATAAKDYAGTAVIFIGACALLVLVLVANQDVARVDGRNPVLEKPAPTAEKPNRVEVQKPVIDEPMQKPTPVNPQPQPQRKPAIEPQRRPEERTTWTIGSSMATVRELQGPPTEIRDYRVLNHIEWYFGDDNVTFDFPALTVIGWRNRHGRLHVH
jgi:hypothetical protein